MTLGCSAHLFHGGCWENLLLMLLAAPPARIVFSLGERGGLLAQGYTLSCIQ